MRRVFFKHKYPHSFFISFMFNHHLKVLASDQSFTKSQIIGCDWDKLCTYAVDEGIASLYYPKLDSIKGDLPEHATQFFRKHYENALVFKDMSVQILKELQPELSKTGRIVLTQGLALSETVYHEPQCRSMGDIDLFLPDGNIDAVRRVFLDYGFKQFRDYKNVLEYKQIMIDLHEGLWGTDRFIQREYIIPGENISVIPGKLVPGFFLLSPKDLALHCAFHGVKHAFYKKIWLLDLLMLYDAGHFTPETHNRQEYILKYLVFEYLNKKGILSPSVFNNKEFCLSPLKKKIFDTLLQLDSPGIGQIELAFLCPSLSKCLNYLVAILIPPKRILQQMYGKFSYLELIIMRIWDLIKYAWKVFN